MIISVINHTNGKVSDAEMQNVIRAINRQLKEDFEPYWSISAQLRLEGKSTKNPTYTTQADMRGDAVLYVWDKYSRSAEGYHDKNYLGIPYGFVFLDVALEMEEEWSVVLSHEALELTADPEVNLLVKGPHPDTKRTRRHVFFWYEMCDAVQSESYIIDGVRVSNFVLPLYFTSGDEYTGRNDFLGTVNDGKTLRSFGVNPGGYVGYYDPKTGQSHTHFGKGDKVAALRMKVKGRMKKTRRAERYKR